MEGGFPCRQVCCSEQRCSSADGSGTGREVMPVIVPLMLILPLLGD